MERYTYFDGGKWRMRVGDAEYSGKETERLAAYEDTGLEPEDMKKAFNEDATLKLAGQILGVTPGRLRELAQAEKEGRLVFITEKMALAMTAGARAIEKNKRLQGVIYNYDVFGKLGAPKEISYFEAAKVLREAAEAALEEREDDPCKS